MNKFVQCGYKSINSSTTFNFAWNSKDETNNKAVWDGMRRIGNMRYKLEKKFNSSGRPNSVRSSDLEQTYIVQILCLFVRCNQSNFKWTTHQRVNSLLKNLVLVGLKPVKLIRPTSWPTIPLWWSVNLLSLYELTHHTTLAVSEPLITLTIRPTR